MEEYLSRLEMKIIGDMTDLELEAEIDKRKAIKRNSNKSRPKLESLVIDWTLENLEKEKRRRKHEIDLVW